MDKLVKFSFGLLANYEGLTVKDQSTVYFITDHPYIYFKGVKYGVESTDIKAVSEITLGADNKTLTINYADGSEAKTIVLAEATQSTAGLMSAADKKKLDELQTNETLTAELEGINESIDKLNGDATTEGSVAKAIADSEAATKTAYEAYADQAELDAIAAAKSETESQIAALDVAEITKSGEYIVAVSETDGKISATTKAIEANEVAVADAEGLYEAANVEAALAEVAKKANTNASDLADAKSDLQGKIDTVNDEIDGIDVKIAALEGAVGAGGSVETAINAAVQNLDSEITSEDGTYVNVTVTQEDGKITAVSVAENNIASAESLAAAEEAIEANKEAIAKLNGDAETEGSVAKAVADAKEELEDTISTLEEKVDGAIADAKTYSIAAIEGDELAALGDNVKEAWKLVDEDGAQAGSAIKIYKDSNLKSVAFADQKLSFTYILADGSEDTVDVDVSAFLAENEFTDGLQVVDHKVSVALAESTDENANYLVMEGEEGSQKLAVREIKTNDTVLQKDIVVAGLTDTLGAGNYENNDVIPAGTDIYTILQNILCKELYPTATNTTGSITASLAAPSVTLDKSGTVEVGTLVKMSAATVASSTVDTVAPKVSGLTYGYSAADDDTVDSTDTSISKTWTTAVTDGAGYTMSATLTGFNADTTTNVQTVPTTVSAQSMAATTLGCVAEGSNIIKVTATGASFTGSVDGIDSVYIASNLGNTDAAKTTTAIAAITDKVSNTPSNSKSITVTGVYKYFMGYSANTSYDQFDSASVRALTTKTSNVTKDGTTTILSSSSSLTSNGTSIVVACPKKYKLATIQNGVGASILTNFSSSGTVSVATGSINTDYTVYVYPITNGAAVEFKNVTLTKA